MASIKSPLVASSRASESVAVLACRLAGLLARVRASPLAGVLAGVLSLVLAVELAGKLACLLAVRRCVASVGGVGLWIASLSEGIGRAFGPKNNEPAASSFANSSVWIFLLIGRTALG